MLEINEYFKGSDLLFRIEFGFKSFRDYFELVENHFAGELDRIKLENTNALAEFRTKHREYSNEEANYIESQFFNTMYEMDIEFRNRFRTSIIIQLFSFLEQELKNLCVENSKLFAKECSLKDLKGDNELDKIKKQLKNSVKIDINSDTKLWNYINDFRKLRNKIVHNDSTIQVSNPDFNTVKKFSKGNFLFQENLICKGEYKITLDNSKFILNSITQIEKFLQKINKDLKEIPKPTTK